MQYKFQSSGKHSPVEGSLVLVRYKLFEKVLVPKELLLCLESKGRWKFLNFLYKIIYKSKKNGVFIKTFIAIDEFLLLKL